MHKRWSKWFWTAAAVLLILTIVFVRHLSPQHGSAASAKGNGQQASTAITVDQSKTGDIGIYVDALGTVTPISTVTTNSQVTGQVMAVHYSEGQLVRQGDPLIDIDPRPFQASLTQAQGTLRRDEGLLAQARMDLQRYEAAYARNGIPKQQLDDQRQLVDQDEGAVQADRGTVAFDQVQLSYCHITSPISGKVGLRLVDPGNTVFAGSGTTLIVITQLQPITVVFSVAEDDLPQIQAQLRSDNELAVDVLDRSNERRLDSGTLGSVDNLIDTTTGTVKFRAQFPNADLSLFPNQFVNARLLVRTLHDATLVPSQAIQHNGTDAFVYVVKPDSTVAVQPVTTLTSNDQVTAVQGLNPGVKLATSGFDRLENGARVVDRSQAQNSAPAQGRDGHPARGRAAPS